MVATSEHAQICYVNGKRRVLPSRQAELTLLEWLRGMRLSLWFCEAVTLARAVSELDSHAV